MPKTSKTRSDRQLAATVRHSANQIFLAGLGAFNQAQKEGTKVFNALAKEGSGVFDRLAKEGASARQRAAGLADAKVAQMKAAASETWSTVQAAFEDRMVQMLHGLNVATKSDIDALARRIGRLGPAKSAGRRLSQTPRAAQRKRRK